ncbi:MAG: phosphotransferase [Exilibacterium sp.]
MVTEYLAANEWCKSAAGEEPQLRAVAGLLRRVHQLPVAAPELDIERRAAHCWRSIEQRGRAVLSQLAPMRTRLTEFRCRYLDGFSAARRACLCHNDPVSENILCCRGALYLIDWEYAAMGSTFFDLAVYMHSEKLDSSAREALLAYYCGGDVQWQRKHLWAAEAGFLYLDLLWHGVHGGCSAAVLEQKADCLLRLLATPLER